MAAPMVAPIPTAPPAAAAPGPTNAAPRAASPAALAMPAPKALNALEPNAVPRLLMPLPRIEAMLPPPPNGLVRPLSPPELLPRPTAFMPWLITPETGFITALIIGRSTIVLNMFSTVSRRFSAEPLPLSNPRINASVSWSPILSAEFLPSSPILRTPSISARFDAFNRACADAALARARCSSRWASSNPVLESMAAICFFRSSSIL